jgi:DNA repair protein RecN (Recombination protein N)
MLALKAVFADADPVDTLVFDEIDAGIGGAVANQVAETMASLARDHQVICVTHLAQIAARAGAHFNVSKSSVKRKTQTSVRAVEHEERIQELARLLDGNLSDASLHHARALLGEPKQESA